VIPQNKCPGLGVSTQTRACCSMDGDCWGDIRLSGCTPETGRWADHAPSHLDRGCPLEQPGLAGWNSDPLHWTTLL